MRLKKPKVLAPLLAVLCLTVPSSAFSADSSVRATVKPVMCGTGARAVFINHPVFEGLLGTRKALDATNLALPSDQIQDREAGYFVTISGLRPTSRVFLGWESLSISVDSKISIPGLVVPGSVPPRVLTLPEVFQRRPDVKQLLSNVYVKLFATDEDGQVSTKIFRYLDMAVAQPIGPGQQGNYFFATITPAQLNGFGRFSIINKFAVYLKGTGTNQQSVEFDGFSISHSNQPSPKTGILQMAPINCEDLGPS